MSKNCLSLLTCLIVKLHVIPGDAKNTKCIFSSLALSLRLKFTVIYPRGSLPKLKAHITIAKITGAVNTPLLQYLLQFYCLDFKLT